MPITEPTLEEKVRKKYPEAVIKCSNDWYYIWSNEDPNNHTIYGSGNTAEKAWEQAARNFRI